MKKQQTVLITGATDGIGKATAIAFAKNGYTVHILGRNKEKGEETLQALRNVLPEAKHELFLVDLSEIVENRTFLEHYIQTYEKLDVLILNALAFPHKGKQTKDGLELTFAVGYVSRYLFSTLLEPLLVKGDDSRVIHIGQGSLAGNVDYDKVLRQNDIDKKYTLSDKVKVTYNAYKADGLFTHFVNEKSGIQTPHEYYHPGTVDTQQIKDGPKVIRFLGKLFGAIISPEKSGTLLATHVIDTKGEEVAGTYYSMGKLMKHKERLKTSGDQFLKLIAFSEKITEVKLP